MLVILKPYLMYEEASSEYEGCVVYRQKLHEFSSLNSGKLIVSSV